MPHAFGYARVSTETQADSGLGLAAQQEAIQGYFESKLKPAGLAWGGLYVDPGVSGSKPLRERLAGGQLHQRLQYGDQVVMAKIDRGFRKAADFFFTQEAWEARSVGLHLLDLQLDTSTEFGKMLCRIMASFAEFERYLIRERTKEAMRQKRAQGLPLNQHAGYGRQIVGRKGGRRIEEDPYEQEAMRKIYDWKNQNYSWEEIYFHLLHHNIKTRKGTEWSVSRIRRAYQAEEMRRERRKDEKCDNSRSKPPAEGSS